MPYQISEAVSTSMLDLVQTAAQKAIKANAEFKKSQNNRNNGELRSSSIMTAGKNLVMSFPVLCDNTISPSTAGMITKAIERMCVAQLQLIFSAANLTGGCGQDVLAKFHHNMNQQYNMDDFLDFTDAITGSTDSSDSNRSNMDQSYDFFERYFGTMESVAANMRDQFLSEMTFFPASSFSESAITDYTVDERFGDRLVSKTPMKHTSSLHEETASQRAARYGRRAAENNADASQQNDAAKIGISAYNADETKRHNQASEKETNRHNTESEFETLRHNNASEELNAKKYKLDGLNSDHDYFKAQLLDTDAKKANELVPSLMIIRFNVIGDDNMSSYVKDFIAGVKARLIPCAAKEIMDHIESVTKNKVSMINLIRATTKEISFAKDFVAAIDQAKIDAKDDSKLSKTSPIWRSLQARSTKSGLNRLRKNKANDASAITTLVVSTELCNLIRNDSSIDLTAPKVAQYIMESYNLMAFVIVDEQMEVAHFLLDGEKYYQDYGFTSLERETGDSSYKKIINLVSQINNRR